ncbi:hypothetical protein Peur_001088 [Populus x canadensis]
MVSKEFLIEKSEGNGEEVGTSVDSVAMVSVLSACPCVSNKAVREGVHGVAMKVGLDKVMGVENTLFDAYIKCGEMSLPGKVLEFCDCCQPGTPSSSNHPSSSSSSPQDYQLVQLKKLMQMGNQAAPLQIALTVVVNTHSIELFEDFFLFLLKRLLSAVSDQFPSIFLISSTMRQLNSFPISAKCM